MSRTIGANAANSVLSVYRPGCGTSSAKVPLRLDADASIVLLVASTTATTTPGSGVRPETIVPATPQLAAG
jgi:hypothetical protein